MRRRTVIEVAVEQARQAGTECMEWAYNKNRGGYGLVRYQGRTRGAHRAVYEIVKGPVPDGMTVHHLCFNPACINPAHLSLLTALENSRQNRNAEKVACVNGHAFTPENTYRTNVNDRRQCRTCKRRNQAAYAARKRSA